MSRNSSQHNRKNAQTCDFPSCLVHLLFQDEFVSAEVWVLFVKSTGHIILCIRTLEALQQAVLWFPIGHVPLCFLDGSEEVHTSKGKGLWKSFRDLHLLGVKMHNFRCRLARSLSTKF